MGPKTELIHNARIFIGDELLLGTAESVTAPDIKYKTKEIEAMGVFGSRKARIGLEAIELKLKRTAISAVNINTHGEVSGKIVGYIQTKEGGTTVKTTVTMFFAGENMESVFGEAKQGEWAGPELSMHLSYFRMLVGDYEKFKIDIDADIYQEDGVDMREW